LLQSAAKAEANLKRLLDLAGVSEQKIPAALGQASDSVSLLFQTTQGADDFVEQAATQEAGSRTNFRQFIEQLRQDPRHADHLQRL
jgi:hypothetical protein